MLLSQLDHQKETQKILVDFLFKEDGYCLCIPDSKIIKSHFEQVPQSWVQNFLLSKNALELSVIPMFMLIFVKNRRLTADQSKRLLELLHLLMSQAACETIDQIFFDNNIKQMAWVYYILKELINFSLADFVNSDRNSKRIMALAAGIEFFFDKASVFTMTKLSLNTENTGFHVIRRLLYVIAYETLRPRQIIYLSTLSKKIIDKTTHFGIETLSFQTQANGFSFICCVLGTWLQMVFENKNINQIKLKRYTQLINSLLEKTNDEKLSSILLEKETKACIIILRYLFFKRSRFKLFHRDLTAFFNFFKRWCKKIFSTLSIQQIELILDNLPQLLINDLSLSNGDRRQLMRDFFSCLFEFCRLQPQEIAILKDLQEQLEDRFFPSNKIIGLFKQVRAHCHFFYCPNFQNLINKEQEVSLDESSDLLSSECARLNAHYSTVSR